MKGYYSHVLSAFTLSARNSKIDVNFASHNSFLYNFPIKTEPSHLRALRPLHLRGCKTRSGQVIDILISFSENLDSKNEGVTIKSRVAVAYFNVDLSKNNASLLLGIHYDFDLCDDFNEPKPRHPRFHAQVSSDVIPPEDIKLVSDTFSYTLQAKPPMMPVSEIARIPTAHMCLASVLVSLAADFFTDGDFSDFVSKVREYTNEFPKPNTKELIENINADKSSLRSCAWYHRDPRTTSAASLKPRQRKAKRR